MLLLLLLLMLLLLLLLLALALLLMLLLLVPVAECVELPMRNDVVAIPIHLRFTLLTYASGLTNVHHLIPTC